MRLQEMKKKMRDEYLSLGGSPNKVRHAEHLSSLIQADLTGVCYAAAAAEQLVSMDHTGSYLFGCHYIYYGVCVSS